MPGAEKHSNKLFEAHSTGASSYGCPLIILGFIVALIVVALLFL